MQELLSSPRQGGYQGSPGRIGMAGPQVPYASKQTMKNLYRGADYSARGYAEDAIAALACAPEPTLARSPSAPSALWPAEDRASLGPALLNFKGNDASKTSSPQSKTRGASEFDVQVGSLLVSPPRLDHARAMQGIHWAGQPDKNLQCSPDLDTVPKRLHTVRLPVPLSGTSASSPAAIPHLRML